MLARFSIERPMYTILCHAPGIIILIVQNRAVWIRDRAGRKRLSGMTRVVVHGAGEIKNTPR